MRDYTASHVILVMIGETPEYVAKIKAIADKANWFDGGATIEIRAYESEDHFKFGIQMQAMARQLQVALHGLEEAAHLSSQHWILAAKTNEANRIGVGVISDVDYSSAFSGLRGAFEESCSMPLPAYQKEFKIQMLDFAIGPDELQARRRGKKKRGHNHDRDRVIGGKAGYC